MCQLLGMNCNVPTDICFSFTGFQARGGATDIHADGWGIAFFEGSGVRVFLDPQPSCTSPIAELVRAYPIHSTNVIAHIRKATQGMVKLENTHPFQRELWGKYWVFAHNGHLPVLNEEINPLKLDGSFLPVGQTDSEKAFCWILQNLRAYFGDIPPALDVLFTHLHFLTLQLCQHGQCNYLLSNGHVLFAHCSTQLCYVERKAPFSAAHLSDHDVTVDFSAVTRPNDRVAIIATQPLTDNEHWETMPAGSLWCFREGEVQMQKPTIAGPSCSLSTGFL
jgi:predicted glutamine amidotransferase